MLILALGGVLVGFAFLVVSLVTENSSWAWGCIVACALAAGVLIVDARRRRAPAASSSRDGVTAVPVVLDAPTEVIPAAVPGGSVAADPEVDVPAGAVPPVAAPVLPPLDAPTEVVDTTPELVAPEPVAPEPVAPEPVVPASVVPEPVVPEAVVPEPVVPEPVPSVPVDDTAEPDEEDADASDALVVAGLEQDVLVVDEHPRFHVPSCTWLAGRETLGLPAREAVELGFTPCSRCAPARTLASLARA